MRQYQEMLQEILDKGDERDDRTGTGTISLFGMQKRYDLSEGFPLVTTKKTAFRLIVEELMWFLKGDTKVKTLIEKKVNIWTDDAYARYKRNALSFDGDCYTKEEFVERLLVDEKFERAWGDLGPIYSEQWRAWRGANNARVDQISEVIRSIKENPQSRRHIVSAWNVADLPNAVLPPCHTIFQFYVSNGKLSLQLYQRSADSFLGVPFNIASYALLLALVAKETGLEQGEFIHTLGDAHIYKDHIEQVKLQLTREPRPLPKLVIKNDRKNIWDYEVDDFELVGYDPHPRIKGKQSS